jgi:subtilisin family serine protease
LDDRRQLQDSPILGDVWVEFGRQPDQPLDLLIAPFRGQSAGNVAVAIDDGLEEYRKEKEQEKKEGETQEETDVASIAFLQGLIVACLTFEEVIRIVAPKTKWWTSRRLKDATQVAPEEKAKQEGGEPQTNKEAMHEASKDEYVKTVLKKVLDSAKDWHAKTGKLRVQEVPTFDRFLALTALILWAGSYNPPKKRSGAKVPTLDEQITAVLQAAYANLEDMSRLLRNLEKKMSQNTVKDPLVWQVSRNRGAMPAISKSVPAVKADAATYLFKVNCSEIGWAVIDSGIDGNHPAFLDKNGKSRVKQSFDFKNFRKIVSIGNLREGIRKKNIAAILEDNDALKRPLMVGDPVEDEKRLYEAHEDLIRLADDARRQGPVRWELVEKYVEIKPGTETNTYHGTHVAGIIGASKIAAQKAADEAAQKAALEKAKLKAAAKAAEVGAEKALEEAVEEAIEKVARKENPDIADGMCPDISLYDFRVLGPNIKDAEFAIIAALQFIRYLNNRDNFFTIHGANLSLSIPHDVRNFACGRTPICDECEQLVASGVVVVAAAGNHGYKSFETKEGSYDSYAAFSITDPGNADSVLTVGATHRFWPHTYGVSFFSSRGPTGDGRIKPDLVAPGERIRAPVPGGHNLGGEWGDLDGTSMAAPHVSGAAAMLMARYSELVGQPTRIKRILCESATDLGRERSFQGHGMLDVLRAFQSI